MSKAKTFTSAELRRVFDYLATRQHAIRNRTMVCVSHMGGLRVGEIAKLTWGDVVSSDGHVKDEIRLSADQTKGRHPRIVFISPKLKIELDAYVASAKARPSDWAFFYSQKNPKRGFTPNTLAQYFLSMYKNAGIDGASRHSGRRSFATNISSTGTSIRVLMRLLGHQNISTTIGYVDASDEMLRKAVALA